MHYAEPISERSFDTYVYEADRQGDECLAGGRSEDLAHEALAELSPTLADGFILIMQLQCILIARLEEIVRGHNNLISQLDHSLTDQAIYEAWERHAAGQPQPQ